MARQRDYKAEYQRRLARGATRGLSRSQARGHPKRAERLISEPAAKLKPHFTPSADDAIYRALNRMERGASLKQAAGAEHMSPERLRRVAHERGYLGKTYDRRGRFAGWEVSRGAERPVLTHDGTYHPAVPFDLQNTSTVSRYWSAVSRLLGQGDPHPLHGLGRVVVRDVDGQTYELATDPNLVIRWWDSLTNQEQRAFTLLFGSEKVTVPRGRAA